MDIVHMRRVIGGRRYDTATATLIAMVRDDGGSLHSPQVERTGLFKTASGAWFIAGESGAHERWGHCDRWGQSPGRGLSLVNADEARDLLERIDGPVEDHFPVVDG